MSSPTFFTVNADMLAIVGAAGTPATVPIRGKVTFTPMIKSGDALVVPTLSPRPGLVSPQPVTGVIGSDGRLGFGGAVGVRLIADTSVWGLSSPLFYTVSFTGLTVNGVATQLTPFNFQAATSDTPINLVSVARVPGQLASGIVNNLTPDHVRRSGTTAVFSANGVDLPSPVDLSAVSEPPITAGTTGQYWRGDKTWQTLNKPTVFNVKDYGAVGSPTNDTAAFNAASAAAGVGGTVYVPQDTYIVNSAALSLAHQRWDFAPGAHLKLPAGATNGQIFTVTGDYVTLDGGEWDGNRANVATQVYEAPIMIVAAHCTVRDAYVHDTDGWGIVVHPSSTTTTIDGTVVENCTLVDTFQGGVNVDCTTYFASTVPSKGVRVSGCWISTSLTPPALYAGVQVVGSTAANVIGATVKGCYIAQPTAGAGVPGGVFWRNVTGMQCVGNYVSGTDTAYTFDTCIDSSVAGCTAYGARLFGIEVGGATTRTAISGCVVNGAGVTQAGIGGDNAPNDELTITSNTIGNLNKTTAGHGISMQTGGRGWTIVGNTISAPTLGITVYGVAATNMTIEGNTLDMESGGTVGFYAGMYLDPIATGARGWSIKNNNLIGWLNQGIQIGHGSSLTVSNITVRDNTYTNTGTTLTLLNVTFDSTCQTTSSVADGGTGRSTSTTAYGLIAAGTTATGAHQTVSAGATTDILVSGGASALPVWTTATGSGAPVRATSPTLTTPKVNSSGSGVAAPLDLQTAGVNRWTIRKNDDAESSTYTGSNFQIIGYDNSGGGSFIGMSIGRDTGIANFIYGLTVTNPGAATGSVVTVDGTQTETNKRITPRIGTVASAATPTINTDNVDQFNITALAAAITSMTTNLSGTPTDGQCLDVRIKGDATPRAITWGASFTGTLLSTTAASKTHLQRLKWDAAAAKWAGYLADATGY